MRKLLFARDLNCFDAFYIALGVGMMGQGHWFTAIIVWVCGVVASVEGEASLARSQAKWS